jgi:hypothetical protein
MRKILCSEHWNVNNVEEFQESKTRLLHIRLELAIVCEGSLPYYGACYNLEGDGPLGAFTYTIIKKLADRLLAHTLESYPIVSNIVEESINELNDGSTEEEIMIERIRFNDYVFHRINAGKNYFHSHFLCSQINRGPRSGDNEFGHLHLMYEGFALVDPENFRLKFILLNSNVDNLTAYIRDQLQFLFNMDRITQLEFNDLMGHIGPYLAIATEFTYGFDANGGERKLHEKLILFIRFWKVQRVFLPQWFQLVKKAILHHPNSCGSERLFSVLKWVLTNDRENSLDDYIRAAVCIRYLTRIDENRIGNEINFD